MTYADAAPLYWRTGWRNAIPVRGKSEPVKGYTGRDGLDVTYSDIQEWIDYGDPRFTNLGVRLQGGIIGIDVDHYGSKRGGDTLRKAEETLGALPPTISSTSRGFGQPARISFYSVPTSLDLSGAEKRIRDTFGEHVDVIHRGHRYALAYPSLHPLTGAQYRWYTAHGDEHPDVPNMGGVAALPAAWVDFLASEPADDAPADDPFGEARSNEHDLSKPIPEGQRDAMIYRYACLMRGKGLERPEIAALVEAYWRSRVTDKATYTLAEAMVKVDQAMKHAPNADAHDDLVVDDDEDEATKVGASWGRVDLTAILAGDDEPTLPTLMPRSDGVNLLYPGLVHSIHGESESGKSWIAQTECARLLAAGRPVLYVDNESDAKSVVERLRLLGVTKEAISTHFDYRCPEASPLEDVAGWQDMLGGAYDLAIIDGVTDSLGLFGFGIKENDDVARWMKRFPRQLAKRSGAAVVLIDHVTKSSEGRGRFAIGGQAKMAGLDGAAYSVDVKSPLGKGLKGRLTIKVGKDRPGQVRGHGGRADASRMQHIADYVLDSTGDAPVATLWAPTADDGDASVEAQRQADSRKTGAREVVMRVLRARGALSRTEIDNHTRTEVPTGWHRPAGRADVRAAVDDLLAANLIETRPGARGGGLKYVAREAPNRV